MLAKITQRTDTAANWTSSNPTLVAGEITVDTTSKRFKVGEAAAYASVPFQDSGPHTTEASVASATTCDIGAATSINVSITGTTTITGFGTVAAGTLRIGRFTGILTLTHNGTSLILPGAANITTAAGDRFIAESLGSGNWVVIAYTKANGEAVVGGAGGSVATDAIFDAKGDLAVGTGANTAAKLTAGANGHVLTADSAEATGLKWAAAAGGSGPYAMSFANGSVTLAAGATRYFGFSTISPGTDTARHVVRPPIAGTITACSINLQVQGVTGTNEGLSIYLRLNDTTDTLIATVGETGVNRFFVNLSMSVAVTVTDYFEFKIVCPSPYVTPATAVHFAGTIIITP